MTQTLEIKSGQEQKAKKINWKQWIPAYGIYQTFRDFDKGKPNVLEKHGSLCLNACYHAASVFSVGAGIYELAERLF